MRYTEQVQQIYAAFGRGEVEAILNHLAPDVEWDAEFVVPDVPWLAPRKGREEVAGFFAAVAGLAFERFVPTAFFESDHQVVAVLDVALTVRETGRHIVERDEIHLWHFDEQGLVDRFSHKVDSYQHWAAVHDAPIAHA